jgi:hypothetical protein
MNKKQKVTLWCGIIILCAVLAFPPLLDPMDLKEQGFAFFFSVENPVREIDWMKMNFQNLLVAVLTGGVIYILKDKKEESGQSKS